MSVVNATGTRKRTLRDVIRSLRQPKVAVMLALGFSSGLPFFLIGNTLGYWLRDEGTALSAIGFLSWVGLAYSLKFLWAPIRHPGCRRRVLLVHAGHRGGRVADRGGGRLR